MSPGEEASSRIQRPWSWSKTRVAFLIGIACLVVVQIVVLSPSSLDVVKPPTSAVDPQDLLPAIGTGATLATGIPKDRVPEYSVDQFDYVSTHTGQKQWRLKATKAFLYNKDKLVHARTIQADLFDPEGKITYVTGKEAKYFMNDRDLEIFGDVVTHFPDGFEMRSAYLRYRPAQGSIAIPESYPVSGGGKQGEGQEILFDSLGFLFSMKSSEIVLPRQVRLKMVGQNRSRSASSTPSARKNEPDETVITSDRCVIERQKQLAIFTMSANRPIKTRFVKIVQAALDAQSREAKLSYGEGASLRYLTAEQDVVIRDTNERPGMRYATAGRAEFDSVHDTIVLREFPQVYQDSDTVTGEVIVMHRDTDIVEVEQANAYSGGEPSQHP